MQSINFILCCYFNLFQPSVSFHTETSFLQGRNHPPPFFFEGTPPFWVPPSFWRKFKNLPLSFWQRSKLVHVNCKKHFKMKVYVSYYTKSTENTINITLFTFRLNSVFTTDTWNISNNHIIKSDVYIKLHLNIFRYISKSGLGMRPRCHPSKSRKRRLTRAMKSPPKGKTAWANIARAKF